MFFVFLVLMPSFNSCNYCGDFLGAYNLGNKLTLFARDNGHYDIIYCTGKSGGCCYGGLYVIPSAGNQYYMYVDTAKSNDDWVIVKTTPILENIEYAIVNKKENFAKTIPMRESYWIINKDFVIKELDCNKENCDSIIQSHILGPLDIEDFNKKLLSLKIDIHF